MTIIGASSRPLRAPGPMLNRQLGFTLLLWAGLLATVLIVTFVASRFVDVTASAWEQAANLVAVYVALIGGFAAHHTVPRLIAHGRTRRDTTLELAVFMVVLSAACAAMVMAGYVVEHVVYGIAGWSRAFSGQHLFSSHLDVTMIFLEYWLNFLVFIAAGALIGVAFYRYNAKGWLALIPASILVGLIGVFTQAVWGPVGYIVRRFLSLETPSLPLAIVAAVVGYLIALALTWSILRDLPIRNR